MAATSPPPLSASSSYSSASPLPDIHSSLLPDLWGGLTSQTGQSKHFPLDKRAPSLTNTSSGGGSGTGPISINGGSKSPTLGAGITGISANPISPVTSASTTTVPATAASIPSSPTSVSSTSDRLSRLTSSASSLGLSTISLPGSTSASSTSSVTTAPLTRSQTSSALFTGKDGIWGPNAGFSTASSASSASTLYQSRISCNPASMMKSHLTTNPPSGAATPVLEDFFDPPTTSSSPVTLQGPQQQSGSDFFQQGGAPIYRTSSALGISNDIGGPSASHPPPPPPAPGLNRHHSVPSGPGPVFPPTFQPIGSSLHGNAPFGGPIKSSLDDMPLTEENLSLFTRAPSLNGLQHHLPQHQLQQQPMSHQGPPPQYNHPLMPSVGPLASSTQIPPPLMTSASVQGSSNPYNSYPSTPPLSGLESSVIDSIFDDNKSKKKEEKTISLLTPTGSSTPTTPGGGVVTGPSGPNGHANSGTSSGSGASGSVSISSGNNGGQGRKKNGGGGGGRPATNTELYKTELCASYMNSGGNCPYGEKCQFAHGETELKIIDRPPKWRSKPCQNWLKTGSCSYNDRCCFRHDTVNSN